MTDVPPPPDDDRIGYGRPPREHRFQKGRSGNPKGRPRMGQSQSVDLAGILDAPRPVRVNGRRRMLSLSEAALMTFLDKAKAGDLKAIRYLLGLFLEHGALDPPTQTGGVLRLPSRDMPWPMAMTILWSRGVPPWDAEDILVGRQTYLSLRTEKERIEDEAIGYADLLEDPPTSPRWSRQDPPKAEAAPPRRDRGPRPFS